MSSAAFDVLRKVTTATITTMLLKKGIRRCWMKPRKAMHAMKAEFPQRCGKSENARL